jgi:hypothetical protein
MVMVPIVSTNMAEGQSLFGCAAKVVATKSEMIKMAKNDGFMASNFRFLSATLSFWKSFRRPFQAEKRCKYAAGMQSQAATSSLTPSSKR